MEIAFLGYKVIYAEYAAAVVLAIALGLVLLFRSPSGWQLLLGIYLICLGINYVPMWVYTIQIGNRQNARAEIADELAESGKQKTMSRYRYVSLFLLLPLVVPVLAVAYERSRSHNLSNSR
ncbi:MAG: hypothetical protein P8Z30_02360 [Acidobacteriota bacterium]